MENSEEVVRVGRTERPKEVIDYSGAPSRDRGHSPLSASPRLARSVPRLTPIQVARFWSKVSVSKHNAHCWEWQGRKLICGYGGFYIVDEAGRRSTYRAHRIAHHLVNGPIPTGLFILHSCDNPLCCNPHHLRAGTVQENTADMVARGRQSGGPKISMLGFKTIMDSPEKSSGELAAILGCSRRAVCDVRNGKTNKNRMTR